jgi:hypothetical protein
MRKRDDLKLLQLRGELKSRVKHLRRAQSDLKKLREIGADESALLKVMGFMGFGNVTPNEFLAAETAQDIAMLMGKLGGYSVN